MIKGKRLIFLSLWGMELCWIYALASYIVLAMCGKPFPLPEAIGISGFAILIRAFTRGRGWMIITIGLLHLAGLVLIFARIAYLFGNSIGPFFDSQWVPLLFSNTKTFMEGFTIAIALFLALCFWAGGMFMGRRYQDYPTASNRFDLGLAMFLVLLLIELAIKAKGGIVVSGAFTEKMLIPFFIFSILAFGLTRNRTEGQKSYMAGYGNLGVLLSLMAIVILFGAGIITFFLPYLTVAAEAGYEALKVAAVPVGQFITGALLLLLGRNRMRNDQGGSSSGGDQGIMGQEVEHSWWVEIIEKIIGWGAIGMVALVVIIVFVFALWKLALWLISRTGKYEARPNPWQEFLIWFEEIRAFFRNLSTRLSCIWKGPGSPVQYYFSLITWARRSGLDHPLSETPMELGSRLIRRFPGLEKQFSSIIQAHNRAIYGSGRESEKDLAMAGYAYKKLKSPLLWPSRIKSLLFGFRKEQKEYSSFSAEIG